MEPDSSPACRCGKPMTFATKISMPRQIVYRCDRCKGQAWILDRRAQRPPNHSNIHGRRATRPLYDASAGNEPIPVSLTRSGCSFQSGRASAR